MSACGFTGVCHIACFGTSVPFSCDYVECCVSGVKCCDVTVSICFFRKTCVCVVVQLPLPISLVVGECNRAEPSAVTSSTTLGCPSSLRGSFFDTLFMWLSRLNSFQDALCGALHRRTLDSFHLTPGSCSDPCNCVPSVNIPGERPPVFHVTFGIPLWFITLRLCHILVHCCN